MRFRSKSANTYNVICEGRVIKVFKYRKAAQRWIDQMTIPAHIEVLPANTPSETPAYEPPAYPRGWDTAGA